ncbi:MAG: PaaI family thioesterase [Bacteroidales bacterium]|nr:PaaI family thioesterase [Bacteroidales bacterium]
MKSTLIELAEVVFAADRYATEATGITIAEVEPHRAVCRLRLEARHRNARGAVMGGVIFTMADFGAAIAANTDCLEVGGLQWVSLGSTVNYLASPRGDELCSETVCVKHGRTTALYRTTVSDGARAVAEVSATMVCVGGSDC